MNVERLLVYINPVVRNLTICVLSYEYGTASVGSRQVWSANVFLCRKGVVMIGNNHEKDLISLLSGVAWRYKSRQALLTRS